MLAYRHHHHASVPSEFLKTGDEAACLCDQHTGVVAVPAWIEYRAMRATDKFQERVAQLCQLWVVKDLRRVGEKKAQMKVNGSGLSGLPAVGESGEKWPLTNCSSTPSRRSFR